MRRTTGAQGGNFLTSFKDFEMLFKLYRTFFLFYLNVSRVILSYLKLSWDISGYLWLTHVTLFYLVLSGAIWGQLWISLAISGYP